MSVSGDEFRKARTFWTSLEAIQFDGNGQITIVTVTMVGITGCKNERRRADPKPYRLLIDVQDLSSLPEVWFLEPPDEQIEHLNVYHATKKCPITGTKLPRLCWGISDDAWRKATRSDRTLSQLLEVTGQLLSSVYPESAAR